MLFPLAYASYPIKAIVTATEKCPLYSSFKKERNPGDAYSVVGDKYKLVALNRENDPEWGYILVEDVIPKQRWISLECIDTTMIPIAKDRLPSANRSFCVKDPGYEDSFVLALSWQPAFCEVKDDKQECKKMEDKYGEDYSLGPKFTLHGLWPNQQACGINYGFCSNQGKKGNWCDYPVLNLSPAITSSLASVMPNLRYSGCLHRYQWYKHGACQAKWDKDTYFQVAIDLTKEFNGNLKQYLDKNIDTNINKEDFWELLIAHYGNSIRHNTRLKCQNNMLLEIQIHLPGDMRHGEGIRNLVSRAHGRGGKDNCPSVFELDRWGD